MEFRSVNDFFKLICSSSLGFLLWCSSLAVASPPEKLDFIGGYYEDGVYLCYSEPCFSIHKGTEAASSRVRPFKLKEWLPKRGSKEACQQAYTSMLTEASKEEVSFYSKDGCKYVVGGLWKDSYTGEDVAVDSIAVDQLISSKEAHRFGGDDWTRSMRLQFVYSMNNIIPVSSAQKKARDGRSPSEWMPENKAYWCDYIVYRDIVARYFALRLPKREKDYNQKIKRLYCKY